MCVCVCVCVCVCMKLNVCFFTHEFVMYIICFGMKHICSLVSVGKDQCHQCTLTILCFHLNLFSFAGYRSHLLAKLCGNSSQYMSFYSTRWFMLLDFRSDDSVVGHGFQLRYRAVLPSQANYNTTTTTTRPTTSTTSPTSPTTSTVNPWCE